MNYYYIMLLSILLFLNSTLVASQKQTNVDKVANTEKPNVLFIAIDDLNDWTGYLKGHPQALTPNLDRFAKSGVAFTHAYPSAPSCGPSRTAILFGLHPYKTGAYGNSIFYSPRNMRTYARVNGIPDMFRSRKSLPTAFRENGYYTAGTGKISHFSTREPDPEIEADFETYFSPRRQQKPDLKNPQSFISNDGFLTFGPVAPDSVNQMLDVQFSDWAVNELNKEHDKPFFLAVGFVKPHMPWVAPQSFFDRLDVNDIQLPEVPKNDLDDIPHAGKIFAQSMFGFFTKEFESDHQYITKRPMFWKRHVRAYLAASTYADKMLGKVLDALDASPYADNTIIVLWGDHGWHLGEKEHWRKFTLWERGTRTPFIIRMPNSPSNGKSVSSPVSLQDIYPTLVDLCRLEIDQDLDGNSLVPLLNNPKTVWEKPALMGHGPGNFAVRLDRWRYIRYQNGDRELYDITKDPKEFKNLAAMAEYSEILKALDEHVPKDFVKLYDPLFGQFENLDTMKVFIR
ncbi:iduronate 2-sulfatase [Pricia antarctica]|uniref:Iduronate 2-sulfatase n=1 Tax=Pricia antarctica TaxID=641691 RepID=A0A1G7J2D1_9FLAO|nr:sulfatase [Pricia antarctica]SDF19028.1 iduronate 2-sulfatase [Pricia antarctica]